MNSEFKGDPIGLLDALPKAVLDEGLPAWTVKSGIDRLTKLDINPDNNLGTFVSTHLDSVGQELLLENYSRNLACQNEYSGIHEIHNRCISILGSLWGSSTSSKPVGSATSGSSEAIYLGILAMKRRWEMSNEGKAPSDRPIPNIITGNHAHIAVINAASANDIEIRYVEVSEESNYSFDPSRMESLIDSGTIGVVLTLGNTYTGHFDPVEETSMVLDGYEKRTGYHVDVHVDAASGGFVAPFNGDQCTQWDFSMPRVVSINASGHKFGLTAATVGWILWRDREYLPSSMVHNSTYLSGKNELPTIRYSQAAYSVIIQYYYLSCLGRQGFENVIQSVLHRAEKLGRALERTGIFKCVSKTNQTKSGTLPVVVFHVRSEVQARRPNFTEEWISSQLMGRGYSLPCCKLPVKQGTTDALRVVVRPSLKTSVVDSFVAELLSLINSSNAGVYAA